MNFVIKPYNYGNTIHAQDIEATDILKACELYSEINKFTGVLLVVLHTLECKAVYVYYEYPRYIANRKIKTVR